jgi:hypothetical protein
MHTYVSSLEENMPKKLALIQFVNSLGEKNDNR